MTEDNDHCEQERSNEKPNTHDAVPTVSTNVIEPPNSADTFSAQRVFKKSSPNNKLTSYLCSRDLVVYNGRIDRLQGVLFLDPDYVEHRKVYGQITLTFRYGREDEEVMGLRFCNEAIMCLAQLYPPASVQEPTTPLQDALIKRLGANAYPISMEITPLAPPSVQLVPAKEYRGAPIGTSYDVRVYVADRSDEKMQKRVTVRMGLRVVQRAAVPPSPALYNPGNASNVFYNSSEEKDLVLQKKSPKPRKMVSDILTDSNEQNTKKDKKALKKEKSKTNLHQQLSLHSCSDSPSIKLEKRNLENSQGTSNQTDDPDKKRLKEKNCNFTENSEENANKLDEKEINENIEPPKGTIVKTFMMSEGQIELEGSLDKAIYSHGEPVNVTVMINNRSHKTVKRIKVFIVQHVDVCMFSNGKFKNVVASIDSKENCPITPNSKFTKVFSLRPVRSSTKNWIALEDSYMKFGTSLASTVTQTGSNNAEERNVFAIFVSYYVKIKLIVSVTTSEISLKLPFTLMHTCAGELDCNCTMIPSSKFEKENVEAAEDT